MATPMSGTQTKAAMKKWKVKTKYRLGWSGWGRPNRKWGPVHGVMIHHTGSSANGQAYIDGLFKLKGIRYPSLPGPLCHASTGPDGVVTIGATKRANHAGAGPANVLSRVKAENYNSELEFRPQGSSVDGNAHFYGNEVRYNGSKPMTRAQYENTVRWAAAICDFYGWSEKSVIGHREWAPGKPDPGKHNMGKFRKDVAKMLAGGPSTKL